MKSIKPDKNAERRPFRYDTPYHRSVLDNQETSAMQCAALLFSEDLCDVLAMLDAHAITLDRRTETKLRAALSISLLIQGPCSTVSQTREMYCLIRPEKKNKKISHVRADVVSVLFEIISRPLWPKAILDQLMEIDS
jgi:hypothetical protein